MPLNVAKDCLCQTRNHSGSVRSDAEARTDLDVRTSLLNVTFSSPVVTQPVASTILIDGCMIVIMASETPLSPTKSHKGACSTKVVPLDSEIRQIAIHPDLSEVKVPCANSKPYQYHPVSCEFLSSEDLQHHKLHQLQKQYTTPEAALKAQAEAVKEVKDRMAEAEKKTREISQQMQDMEKTREIERKIYMKQGKSLPDRV